MSMTSRMQALVSCPGPLGIFEQSAALADHDWLGRMAIGFYAKLGNPPLSWLPDGWIRNYLGKRYHPDIPADLVRSHPLPAVGAMLGIRVGSRTDDAWVFWTNDKHDASGGARFLR